MGLDMYAFRVAKHAGNTDFKMEGEKEEIAYWRKFNALHGWMEDLYLEKGGEGQFNCDPLRLTVNDLHRLRNDVDSLQPRGGFFFGALEYDDDDKQQVLDFVDLALEAINNGFEVYYDSWW